LAFVVFWVLGFHFVVWVGLLAGKSLVVVVVVVVLESLMAQ
jgi:hypothetical protein